MGARKMSKVKARTKLRMKTVAQLIEEIRASLDNTAAEYIPQLSQAVKAENPKLSKSEQREMIERICREFWAAKTIMNYLPREFKDEKHSFSGKLGNMKMQLNRAAKEEAIARTEMSKPETDDETEEEEALPMRSPISVQEELRHDDHVDDQYDYMRRLIELLSGVDYIKERGGNLELVERTKDHRFKLIKRLSDLDVKTVYTYGRTLALILNDYLKQLDNELDVRQAKEKLVSE
jgi:hypothetical protein